MDDHLRMMGDPDLEPPRAGLVGRGRECAVIDRLLDRASRGESGSLVLRGEVGVGKTALLGYAADRAAEMTVLRAAGVELESDLAFAGLHSLVRPIVDQLPELPGPQRAALEAALGLGPAEGSDRFLVSAAVLSLLAAAAEDRPILCLVDDAQWLDVPSADSLVFTARRLGAEGIVILFAAREGEVRRFDAPGLDALAVGSSIASRHWSCSTAPPARLQPRCVSDFWLRLQETHSRSSSFRRGSPALSSPGARNCRRRYR